MTAADMPRSTTVREENAHHERTARLLLLENERFARHTQSLYTKEAAEAAAHARQLEESFLARIVELEDELDERTAELTRTEKCLRAHYEEQIATIRAEWAKERESMHAEHEQVLEGERMLHQQELSLMRVEHAEECERRIDDECRKIKLEFDEKRKRDKETRRLAVRELETQLKKEREAFGLAIRALTEISQKGDDYEQLEKFKREQHAKY